MNGAESSRATGAEHRAGAGLGHPGPLSVSSRSPVSVLSCLPLPHWGLSGRRGQVSGRRGQSRLGSVGMPRAPTGPQRIPVSSTHTGGQSGRLLADLDPRPTLGIRARTAPGREAERATG